MDFLPDPIQQYFRQVRRWIRNLMIVALAFVAISLVKGVPHFQLGNYTYHRMSPYRTPSANEKLTGWYLSVTGWRKVGRGQYGPLKWVIFIPIRDCMSESNPNPYVHPFTE